MSLLEGGLARAHTHAVARVRTRPNAVWHHGAREDTLALRTQELMRHARARTHANAQTRTHNEVQNSTPTSMRNTHALARAPP